MKALMATALLLAACSVPASAADGISGAWTAGTGAARHTYVFKARGDRFTGIVCGPCDDPSAVFRIEEGRILEGGRLTFSIRYDVGGPEFRQYGPYRAEATATRERNQLTVRAQRAGSREPASVNTTVLKRVVEDFDGLTLPAAASLSRPAAPDSKPSPIEGRWIAAGRVSQQNFILKIRDNAIWGLVCGPCNPEGVFMIDDGSLEGEALTFYINHMDTPPSPQQTGLRRNVMRGTLTGNVMKFTWVREGAEDQPGGEMVLIGPIR